MWGRGLKRIIEVASVKLVVVAPRVGAWIETKSSLVNWSLFTSPLAWGRGLKLDKLGVSLKCLVSPLAWGRGLKHISVGTGIICTGRLPRGGVD